MTRDRLKKLEELSFKEEDKIILFSLATMGKKKRLHKHFPPTLELLLFFFFFSFFGGWKGKWTGGVTLCVLIYLEQEEQNKVHCDHLRNHSGIIDNGTSESCLTRHLCCTSKESREISPTQSLQGASISPKAKQLAVC